jgi:uncharacterized protein (DUF1501 family)
MTATGSGSARRSCGCRDHATPDEAGSAGAPRGFGRRAFLRRSAVLAAATGLMGRELATRVAFAASPAYAGDVLVVLSFRGGFDGLSCVVPRNDANLVNARPNIRVPDGTLLALGNAGNGNDNRFGLHPAMAPLMPMWNAGTFGLVQAVGQLNPTRSHFEAMEEMEKAAPGSSLRTGWIDRVLGERGIGSAFQAAAIGNGGVTTQFQGPAPELGLYRIDNFDLSGAGDDLSPWDAALRALNVGGPLTVQGPVATTLGALATTRTLTAAGYTPENGALYDGNSDLAMSLRDVARLVKADVGLQVAAVDYGDWDMHEGLADNTLDPTEGWMHDKLTELSGALAAFFTDLGPTLTGRVSMLTLSEFGRRVEENGSHGLDHGHGNAVLLLGGGIVGGRVHGTWPGLADAALDNGDLAATTDYRNLIGELLVKRCGASSVSSVFPGLSYSALGIAH